MRNILPAFRISLLLLGITIVCPSLRAPALAQAHHPFSVGIAEGGGSATGISGWLLAQQAMFGRMLSGAVRAAKADGSALWMLSGLSFLYGVFHAAGPGHGKAVITSYMFANERALRRGVILSFMAAALQGLVAIALIGVLALVLHATAQRMRDAAQIVETLSYSGIIVLGLWLVWRKGSAFVVAWRSAPAARNADVDAACSTSHVHSPSCVRHHNNHAHRAVEPNPPHGAVGHVHGPHYGHVHAPDPLILGDRFRWTSACLTVVAAGLRPCSGAILVLVFALAQGIFFAGICATLAMSLGTTITTSVLASLAVLAGNFAARLAGQGSRRGELIMRGIEAAAGVSVLLVGLGLVLGMTPGGA